MRYKQNRAGAVGPRLRHPAYCRWTHIRHLSRGSNNKAAESGSGPVLRRVMVVVEKSCRGGRDRSSSWMGPALGSPQARRDKLPARKPHLHSPALPGEAFPAHARFVLKLSWSGAGVSGTKSFSCLDYSMRVFSDLQPITH